MIKLSTLLHKMYLEDLNNSYLMEAQFSELNELKIDHLNSYDYTRGSNQKLGVENKTWSFTDRCDNNIVAVYLPGNKEFKTGYQIEGVSTLIFEPEKITEEDQLIKPCPDDKRISTVYKILIDEVIPAHVLNKKPNRLLFNPVSSSRGRLVSILIKKVLNHYPQLVSKNNYIVHI